MTPLAWTIAAGLPLCALAAVLDWIRRRERRSLTWPEWRARFELLGTVRPMKSRLEGKDGVCRPERKPKQSKTVEIRKAGGR